MLKTLAIRQEEQWSLSEKPKTACCPENPGQGREAEARSGLGRQNPEHGDGTDGGGWTPQAEERKKREPPDTGLPRWIHGSPDQRVSHASGEISTLDHTGLQSRATTFKSITPKTKLFLSNYDLEQSSKIFLTFVGLKQKTQHLTS